MDPPTCALPKLSHLSFRDYEHVYEPAEDTWLFVDTLHHERDFLKNLQPALCLEVGGGSGCLTAALGGLLGGSAAFFVTDINPLAASVCVKTGAANGVGGLDVVHTSLVSSLEDRLCGKVDVLLFNPPYVVTPHEEIESSLIARAWAGGVDGREVLDELLPKIHGLMAPGGVVYLVAIEENKPKEICERLVESGMSCAEVLTRRKAHNERLMIIKSVK
mmetsp:Transcript_12828/g.27411  ORF Transcript_12828/g.27411 Transcript_12828/m.27411 type:complete len:218 (+) Transcript_12828:3-656(+)